MSDPLAPARTEGREAPERVTLFRRNPYWFDAAGPSANVEHCGKPVGVYLREDLASQPAASSAAEARAAEIARYRLGSLVACAHKDCVGCDPAKPRGFWCESQPRVVIVDHLGSAPRPAVGEATPTREYLLQQLECVGIHPPEGEGEPWIVTTGEPVPCDDGDELSDAIRQTARILEGPKPLQVFDGNDWAWYPQQDKVRIGSRWYVPEQLSASPPSRAGETESDLREERRAVWAAISGAIEPNMPTTVDDANRAIDALIFAARRAAPSRAGEATGALNTALQDGRVQGFVIDEPHTAKPAGFVCSASGAYVNLLCGGHPDGAPCRCWEGFGPTPAGAETAELERTLAKIKQAEALISDLNHGRREWRMSIPAQRDYDPDLVIGDALHWAASLLAGRAGKEWPDGPHQTVWLIEHVPTGRPAQIFANPIEAETERQLLGADTHRVVAWHLVGVPSARATTPEGGAGR